MVKHIYFLAVILALTIALAASSAVHAQNIVYSVDHQWAQIFINQDGTIDLTYNITLTTNSGVIHGFYVGQPKSDFTIGQALLINMETNFKSPMPAAAATIELM